MHTFNSSTEEVEAKFEVSLVYTMSFRTVRDM